MGASKRCVGFLSAALAAICVQAGPAGAATPVAVEYDAGINNGSFEAAAGPDGNLWFAEIANMVLRVTPAGVATEFGTGITGGSLRGIAAGPDGNMWFTEAANPAKIGRINPASPEAGATEFTVGLDVAGEPENIIAGPDGNLWFTEPGADKIGRITPTGTITEFSTGADTRPRGITVGSDGNLWFTEYEAFKIGRITTAGVITHFPTVGFVGGPVDIVTGPDRNLWITGQVGNQVHRFDPANTAAGVTSFGTGLSPAAGPASIAVGEDGNLWFTEVGDERIGRITPAGVITEFTAGLVTNNAFPSFGIAAGPDGNLWFSEQNIDQVGRINTALDPPAFRNPAQITLPAVGAGTPYPSSIPASGLQGTVTGVTARLFGLSHGFPEDIEALLVGPQGQRVKLISDAATGGNPTHGITLTLSDAGPRQLPASRPLVSGIYQPTDFTAGDSLPAPAPAAPYSSTLAAFNGTNPNGAWQLYVADDFTTDAGAIHGGWGLDIATTGPPPVATPATPSTNTKKKKCAKKKKKKSNSAEAAKKKKKCGKKGKRK